MRFQGAGSVAILWLLAAASASRADESSATAQVDFSVLTPAMEGEITAGNSELAYVPYVGGFAGLGRGANSKRLQRLAANERYDPVRTIADRVLQALREAGYTAAYEPIPRRPSGSVQSLSWSDLPEHPKGKLFLDLNIRGICLCTGMKYFKHRPVIYIAWRLLDRRNVVEPTRNLSYAHAPPRKAGKKSTARAAPASNGDEPYPVVEVSESCGFDSIDEAEKNPLRLWGCFAEAYDVAVQRLAIDLARLRPPAAPSRDGG